MSVFKDIYDVSLDALEARKPFKITIGIRDDPPSICVSITNQTRKSPLFVHAVRIHYGQKDYNYSITLAPFEKQQIEAKDTQNFKLSPAIPLRVSLRQIVEKLPAAEAAAPSFESSADLFRAIANGNAKDSWIEVDFNEFQDKRFKAGHVKTPFREVLKKGVSNQSKPIQKKEKGSAQKLANHQALATLKISASMQLRHTDKKQILLVVEAVNMASKTAFIKKVAIILPNLTLTTVSNPSIQLSPETSELVAFQNPRIIEIKADGGLFTWEMVLKENLQYGIDEIEGEKIGKGYVELTSGEKLEFHYLPLPESAWKELKAPISPVFGGKTGHKCSQCGTVILVPIDAVTAICHDCQHIDRVNPSQTPPTRAMREKIGMAAEAIHMAYLQIVNSYEDCKLLVEDNSAEKLRARQGQFQDFAKVFASVLMANSVYLPPDAVSDIRTTINECIRFARLSARVQMLIDSQSNGHGQKVVDTQYAKIEKLEAEISSLREKAEAHFRRLLSGQ